MLQLQESLDADVGISEKDAVRIGAKCVGGRGFVCALRREMKNWSINSPQMTILAVAQILKDDSYHNNVHNQNSITVKISDHFANGHGFSCGDRCVVKVASVCPDVHTVVLRALSRNDALRIGQERHLWATSLLLKICKHPTVVRLGEPCRLEDKLPDGCPSSVLEAMVVGCEPVAQGLLSSSTTLKVLNQQDIESSDDPVLEPMKPENDTSNEAITRPGLKLFEEIASLALSLCEKDLGSQRILYICIVKFIRRLLWNEDCCLGIQIMPKALDRSGQGFSKTICPFNVVFVSQHILDDLRLPNLSWVRVGVLSSTCVAKPAMRLIQLCSTDFGREKCNVSPPDDPQRGLAYVTPVMWFNLNSHPSTLVQPDAKLIIKKMGIFGDGRVDDLSLPRFAKEIHVSVIMSPNYSAKYKYDSQLTKYFTVTRYLCKGDVFCIVHKGNVVHFMVNSVSDSNRPRAPSIVNKEYTSLYQSSPVNGYIPATMPLFWSPQEWHPVWDTPFPAGIGQHVHRLMTLIISYCHTRNISSDMALTACLSGPSGCGKFTVLKCAARLLNMHLCVINCWNLKSDSVGAMEAKIRNELKKAFSCSPCIVVLKNLDALCADKEENANEARVALALRKGLTEGLIDKSAFPACAVAVTSNFSRISIDLATIFLHHINIESPTLDERANIIADLSSQYRLSSCISLMNLARLTPGFMLGDLCSLMSFASWIAFSRWTKLSGGGQLSQDDQESILASGPMILESDFELAAQQLQQDQATAIGAPKVPGVKWEDVGGLETIKAEILDTIQLPLQHPELFSTGLRRSGVLLYGPPGTGKTLLAKTVATECSLNFLSVKGPELINMYVGQSEENVREVFQRAQSASPCVIFFDELDSLAPNRGHSGDSGGVMDRVVSQLLAELDGIQKSKNVYVMGATNRPDLLDPALLRPGRFDRLLFVGVSATSESKFKILKALTRKFILAEDVDLVDLASRCPVNLTGADLSALCTNALFNALSKRISALEKGENVNEQVEVTQEDFNISLHNLIPSVSEDDLLKYRQLQEKLLQ